MINKPTMSQYASREDWEAAMEKWLEENDDDEFVDGDDYYDERGNVSPGGLYDAGGHPIPERWADYGDYLRDRMRDEGF